MMLLLTLVFYENGHTVGTGLLSVSIDQHRLFRNNLKCFRLSRIGSACCGWKTQSSTSAPAHGPEWPGCLKHANGGRQA